jgi:hypothetical protein
MEYQISVISDNRLSKCFNSAVPSIYITHQLKVMSGNTTWITSKLHPRIYKKNTLNVGFRFGPNLSGELDI